MAVTSLDQLLAAMPTGPNTFLKSTVASLDIGNWHSLWQVAGRPQAAANPATTPGEIPTSATQGAFPFTNPSGGALSYLARLFATGAQIGTLVLYDRLVQCSFDGTITTAQNINTVSVNRPSGGAGELWIENINASSNTRTLTATYTNQAGTSGRTATVSLPSTNDVGTLTPVLPLSTSSGVSDTGARSVQTVQIAVGTTGATALSVVLMRRLAEIPFQAAYVPQILDAISLGRPQIYDSSCLAMMILLGATSTGAINGSLSLAQG